MHWAQLILSLRSRRGNFDNAHGNHRQQTVG